MRKLRAVFAVFAVCLALNGLNHACASEPIEETEIPMTPADAQTPPPLPENTCADWPYCLILLNPKQ